MSLPVLAFRMPAAAVMSMVRRYLTVNEPDSTVVCGIAYTPGRANVAILPSQTYDVCKGCIDGVAK